MKYVVAVALGLSALTGLGCEEMRAGKRPDNEPTANLQPADGADASQALLLEDEPLLLEDAPLLPEDSAPRADTGTGADNSRCHVCHINYSYERIAVRHAAAGIGCADCHGESDAHIADESWASGGNGTAPDRMFLRDQVNPFCQDCHQAAMQDVAEHEAIVAGTSEQVCTDCHGNHRLTRRRCKWK